MILFFVVNTTANKALTTNNEAYNATFIVSPVFGASFLVVVVVFVFLSSFAAGALGVIVVVPLSSDGFDGVVGSDGFSGVVVPVVFYLTGTCTVYTES